MTPINLDGVMFPTMWAEKGLSCKPLQKCRFKWGRHSSPKERRLLLPEGRNHFRKNKAGVHLQLASFYFSLHPVLSNNIHYSLQFYMYFGVDLICKFYSRFWEDRNYIFVFICVSWGWHGHRHILGS